MLTLVYVIAAVFLLVGGLMCYGVWTAKRMIQFQRRAYDESVAAGWLEPIGENEYLVTQAGEQVIFEELTSRSSGRFKLPENSSDDMTRWRNTIGLYLTLFHEPDPSLDFERWKIRQLMLILGRFLSVIMEKTEREIDGLLSR